MSSMICIHENMPIPPWGIYIFLKKEGDRYCVAYVGCNDPAKVKEDRKNPLPQTLFGRIDKELSGEEKQAFPEKVFEYHKTDIEENYKGDKKKFWEDFLKDIILIYFFVEDFKRINDLEKLLIRELSPKYNKKGKQAGQETKCFATLEEVKSLIEECIKNGKVEGKTLKLTIPNIQLDN